MDKPHFAAIRTNLTKNSLGPQICQKVETTFPSGNYLTQTKKHLLKKGPTNNQLSGTGLVEPRLTTTPSVFSLPCPRRFVLFPWAFGQSQRLARGAAPNRGGLRLGQKETDQTTRGPLVFVLQSPAFETCTDDKGSVFPSLVSKGQFGDSCGRCCFGNSNAAWW